MEELEVQVTFDLYIGSMKTPTLITPSPEVVFNSADKSNQPHLDLLDNDLKNLTLIKHLKNISENFVLHNLIARRLYTPAEGVATIELVNEKVEVPYVKYAISDNPAAIEVATVRLLTRGETQSFYGVHLQLSVEGHLTASVDSSGFDPYKYLVILL